MTEVERYFLAPEYSIARVIKGGWQLAGGHGPVDREAAVEEMRRYVQAGITTFDCADIYTGVEALIGDFRRRYGDQLPPVQVHTKYVPDLDGLAHLRPQDTRAIIERSLERLGMERLDLVQFHWWDYDVPGYVQAAQTLAALQQEGKIRYVAVTNFDTLRLKEILAAGVPVRTIQLQYSVLDRRPERGMVELCRQEGITLLCYGTLAGGFLGEKWLGLAEPQGMLENRSLTKYKLIIDDFGGWERFQALLKVLQAVGQRHGVSLSAVATRWVLQKEGVGAAIVGMRHAGQLEDTLSVFGFQLDAADLTAIEAVTADALGPSGDVYSLEREKGGRHAGVMKYNLNKV